MRFVSSVTLFVLILHYGDCCWLYDAWIENTIQQPIDHFNEKDTRTFNFMYYSKPVNGYSQPNAPLYLWLVGNKDDGPYYFGQNSSLVDQLVKETNGTVYFMFQRYIKIIHDDDILPHDKDYFKYLTTEQVLADYANLIKSIKSQPGFESSKVVILGTNEGAKLATWMRMKYPELVDAAVATNAELLAKKDFIEYYNATIDTVKKYGTPDCLDKLAKHYHSIEEKVKTTKGIQRLIKEYKICHDVNFTVDLDRKFFWSNGVYESDRDFLSMYNASYLKTVCESMTTDESSPTKGSFINMKTSELSPIKESPIIICFDSHVEFWKENFYILGYMYQQCTEFGQFRYTSAETTPFTHVPLEFHLQLCNVLFGIDKKRIDEGIAKTNEKFGGVTPNVTKVVFTYGELDPNRLLGVTKNLSDTVVSYVIDGVGALNVPYITPNDSKELVETRNAVISLIKKWISA